MKQLIRSTLLCFALITFSCNQKSNATTENSPKESNIENQTSTQVVSNTTTSFDINSIAVSHAELGSSPYLSSPKGYQYEKQKNERKYEEKFFFYKDSLVMTIGGKYFHTRIVPVEDEEFSERYIVKNYEQAIKKIGGVEIYSGRIPNKASDLLRNESMRYAEDMYDPYPYHYKQYLVRTPTMNIWFELCYGLNIPQVDFTVISEEIMEESIEVTKADELKAAIAKDGKAILYINFDTDKSSLKTDGVEAVNEISKLMLSEPNLKLSIEGHTDNTGNAAHNKKLSTVRAQTVVNKLVELNVNPNRLKAIGHGADKPLVDNDTDLNRAKNRRVEIVKIN